MVDIRETSGFENKIGTKGRITVGHLGYAASIGFRESSAIREFQHLGRMNGGNIMVGNIATAFFRFYK